MYYLHLVKLILDERKTLTKVSTRTTSHNHSPKQAQASDTKEQENQQTRQKASCIARGENQFPAVCIIKFSVVCTSTNIVQYRTRGQQQRHKANEMAYTNRCSAHIEYVKPNTNGKMQRQKVPDDEDIDMDKIVKDDKPRYDRKQDFKNTLQDRKSERQLKEKEAK